MEGRVWWAVDVHYREESATVAGIGVHDLSAADGLEAVLEVPGPPADYEPGAFYRRELPLLLRFLEGRPARGVIVDGFVWLGPDRKGLGAHLHDALGCPVIGVAKTGFSGAEGVAEAVRRGEAARPLWITAVGMDVSEAARIVEAMHGPFRLPTLLKRVDRLCRDSVDCSALHPTRPSDGR